MEVPRALPVELQEASEGIYPDRVNKKLRVGGSNSRFHRLPR